VTLAPTFPRMEIATLTRRRPAQDVARPPHAARRLPLGLPGLALILLALATLVGFVIYPTYPNYDSYYSLLWGRELLHGTAPSFDAYRSPTEHPLAIAFGAVLSLLGDPADRIMVGATLASFVALAAGVYRLARVAFTPVVGLVAAALVCTRFDFPFLAARGYIDVPYLALVVWAAVLEAERPRRGGPVFALLVCGGLMRPEAWLIAGVYFLWVAWPASWATRVRYAALTALAPVIWVLVDFAVTGHPFFSLQHTSGLAEELGRTKGLAQVPGATVQFLKNLDKAPVFYAGILGFLGAAWAAPRRLAMPAALLATGVGTFFLVGIAGLSVIDRYLLVPSLMVMVFAAVAIAGWSMLERGRLRTAWMVGAVLLVGYGVAFTATHVNLQVFRNQLTFRGNAHASLQKVLAEPAVTRARRLCGGPLSTPNHKLIPDSRWVLKAGVGDVVARADPAQARRIAHGVALYVTDRTALLNQALADPTDDPLDSVPLPGFHRIAVSAYYGIYASC
jgi:hypothetical protein